MTAATPVRSVKAPLPGVRMAGGIVSTMETVAGYVLGILVVGIILGVFILISSMTFNINGTKYTLIPSQIASLGQSTTMTLISIIIVVAIVVLLIPVVRYLMDLFGSRGGAR
jgi:ABC-type Na+ efflux pump permease subunit